jgi:hypothetical protein
MSSGAHKILTAVALLLMLGPGSRATAEDRRVSGVAGRVRVASSPIATAGIYAYQLSDFSLHKVLTDAQGNFLFQDLPAGLYKIIAHKAGFEPVVVMLTRTTDKAYQFLELELTQAPREPQGPAPEGEDIWSLRARIPADVLRDIETAGAGVETARFTQERLPVPAANGLLAQFHTDLQAMTGVDGLTAASGSQVSGARVGIEGKVGQMQVGLRGHFWQFEPSSLQPGSAGSGQTSAVSLDLESSPGSKLNVSSLSSRLGARQQGIDSPIDFEHYRVSWSQPMGGGQSDFAAQYTSQSNFSRAGATDPAAVPEASRTWRVEGSYTTSFSPRSSLQAGLRYRDQQFGLLGDNPQAFNVPGSGNLDVFGRGSYRLQPAFVVEYGLYSTLSDGSVEMTPRGGVVLRLGDAWQLETAVSRRAYNTTSPLEPAFLPTLYQESDLCEEGSRSCYEVHLSRAGNDGNSISLGAVDRTFGKTLRLYFSEDLFDRLESLYLVPGDDVPELRLSVTRRLAPKIVSTFEGSLASGGGGTFYAAGGQSYENRVQYLTTSVDTRFQSTATGVFIAFHHLSQGLSPFGGSAGTAASTVEIQRLQLMLSQDLNILFDLAGTWAVQLNMELSRSSTSPLQTSDAGLHKRFLGGIAVKF